MRTARTRRWLGLLLAAAALGLIAQPAAAQGVNSPGQTQIDPRVFGFDIPPGLVRPGGERRVTTIDEAGNAVVAKVHVEVGSHLIVMLPDGQLVGRRTAEAQLSERPFQPVTKDELAKRLLADSKLNGFKMLQSRRYLYIYNTSETFAAVTRTILETMFPGVEAYVKGQRIDTSDPDVPMVVIMFRTEEEYQAYSKMPPGMVAYYNTLSNHVVMYEEAKIGNLKPELAIQQGLSTIAHEGAHQILHNIGVQQRLSIWPMWLSEGLAEYFAPTTTGKRLTWKGAGQVNDMRMFELEHYLKARDAEGTDGEMIHHTVVAARLTSTGYATAWSLTHFLAKTYREQFNGYVRELSRLRPLEGNLRVVDPGIIPDNQKLFTQHFGDDYPGMEKKLVLYLKRLPYNDPFAEWPHFVALAAVPVGRRVERSANVFHSQELAEKWQRDLLDKVPAENRSGVSMSLRLLPNRPAAEGVANQWLRGG